MGERACGGLATSTSPSYSTQSAEFVRGERHSADLLMLRTSFKGPIMDSGESNVPSASKDATKEGHGDPQAFIVDVFRSDQIFGRAHNSRHSTATNPHKQ